MNAIQRWYWYVDPNSELKGLRGIHPGEEAPTDPEMLWCRAKDVETLETLVAESTQKAMRARADRTIADDLVKSLRGELIDKDMEIARLNIRRLDLLHMELNSAKIHNQSNEYLDAIMMDCPDGECWRCAEIICPHKDGMHFHHDGCPSCAEAG